jgi:hypothetical protein
MSSFRGHCSLLNPHSYNKTCNDNVSTTHYLNSK